MSFAIASQILLTDLTQGTEYGNTYMCSAQHPRNSCFDISSQEICRRFNSYSLMFVVYILLFTKWHMIIFHTLPFRLQLSVRYAPVVTLQYGANLDPNEVGKSYYCCCCCCCCFLFYTFKGIFLPFPKPISTQGKISPRKCAEKEALVQTGKAARP